LEDVDECTTKELPPSPGSGFFRVVTEHLANKVAAMFPQESTDIRAVGAGILPHKVCRLVEDLPCKMLHTKEATAVTATGTAECRMAGTRNTKGFS